MKLCRQYHHPFAIVNIRISMTNFGTVSTGADDSKAFLPFIRIQLSVAGPELFQYSSQQVFRENSQYSQPLCSVIAGNGGDR